MDLDISKRNAIHKENATFAYKAKNTPIIRAKVDEALRKDNDLVNTCPTNGLLCG